MSAPEPRSTPGPSTGTPEPSQAASEACGDEVPFLGDDVRAPAMELVRSDEVARLREALEQVRALWCPLCGASPAGSERECSWCGRLDAILASADAEARGACTPERVMAATGWSRERIAGLAGHFGATLPAPDETAADDDTLREAIDDAVWDVLSGYHEVMDVEARADEVADAVLGVLHNRGLIR